MLWKFIKKLVKCRNLFKYILLERPLLEVLCVETIFVSFMISLHITTKLSIVFPTHLPYLQLHDAGFQFFFFFCTHDVLLNF